MTPKYPPIAIIMRSKNEMPYLQEALNALPHQSVQSYTLYNVDSGSTDGGVEVIKEHNNASRITQIKPESYIPGKVLNMMIAQTTEPIIVFLNGDAIPHNNTWLETLITPIIEDTADATFSVQHARENAFNVVKYDYQRAYHSKNIKGDNSYFFSAVSCAFKRSLWESEPFYEDGYSEDFMWSRHHQQQGARFKLVPQSIVEHSHNYTLRALFKKRFRHGIAFASVTQQQPIWFRQIRHCFKEVFRDILYFGHRFQIPSMCYAIVYRIIIHYAFYQGLKWVYQSQHHPSKAIN